MLSEYPYILSITERINKRKAINVFRASTPKRLEREFRYTRKQAGMLNPFKYVEDAPIKSIKILDKKYIKER